MNNITNKLNAQKVTSNSRTRPRFILAPSNGMERGAMATCAFHAANKTRD